MKHTQRIERLERAWAPPVPVRYVVSFEGDDAADLPPEPGTKIYRVTWDAGGAAPPPVRVGGQPPVRRGDEPPQG